MSRNLAKELKRRAEQTRNDGGAWVTGVPAIVAENVDPDRQHRVKVVIPSIDEDLVFDEWARQLVLSCLGDEFGAVWVPPVGSEVVLFGQLGQKFNLFYMSVYNEEMRVPEGYDNEMSVGAHVPGNLAYRAEEIGIFSAREINFHADELAKTEAADVETLVENLHKTTAQDIESAAEQENKLTGDTVKLEGSTVTVNGDGSITITGGSIQITGSSIKLFNRTVNQVGPPI